MIKNSFRSLFYIAVIAFLPSFISAQASVESGKALFTANCAQCHAKSMTKDATGPALAGAEERWADYPQEDLYNWIKNSQKMIFSVKHPRAVELWNQYNNVVMNTAEHLSDEDIESILMFIQYQVDNPVTKKDDDPNGEVASSGAVPTWLYWVLFLALGILALILARVISSLNYIVAKKEGREYERKTLLQTLTSKGVVSFVLFAAVLFAGYTTVNNAVNLGRQEGYAPEQPIKFSHETHAGIQGIDCQYCHDGARRSKHAVIPAANTCMNCHSAINVGSTYGTGELTKIYASIGWDPANNKYIDGYEDLSRDEIKDIYTKWIGDNYKKENKIDLKDDLTEAGKKLVADQWEDLVESLTNDQKTKIAGPIEWVRIHNLPDHVYFNHAQHVTVGGLECQQCHGEVEEMEVMSQHAPLSMGWCINCHRQTNVQFSDNEYYTSYETYHKDLASGAKDGVTVEDIGGLECQKCHY